MDNNLEKLKEKKNIHNKNVHHVLFHSYSIYLMVVILGVLFDLMFPYTIFSNPIYQYIGIIMIIFGTIIIYWAQTTTGKPNKLKKGLKNSSFFKQGPYKYLPHPTHFGLFIMCLGFSLMINSLFAVFFILIAHILTRIIFIKKEEKILEEKYGEKYLDYKTNRKNIL